MSTINFEAKLFKIGSETILRLPKEASTKLPSRGMVMVEGTINGPACQQARQKVTKIVPWIEQVFLGPNKAPFYCLPQ